MSDEEAVDNPLLDLEREAFSDNGGGAEETEDTWSVILKSIDPSGTPSAKSAGDTSGRAPPTDRSHGIVGHQEPAQPKLP